MDKHINPQEFSAVQLDQAKLAEAELLFVMRGLVREGVDYRVVLAGMMTATMDMVGGILGRKEVPIHFARCAYLTCRPADLD